MHDDLSLRALYCAADALVEPLREEAFGQTVVEAPACGTPVVAFGIGGLPDIVEHKGTGYLAQAFDVADLATGIQWVVGECMQTHLSEQARNLAELKFKYSAVASKYKAIYKNYAN